MVPASAHEGSNPTYLSELAYFVTHMFSSQSDPHHTLKSKLVTDKKMSLFFSIQSMIHNEFKGEIKVSYHPNHNHLINLRLDHQRNSDTFLVLFI